MGIENTTCIFSQVWRKEREEQRDKNREKEARVDEWIVQGLAHFLPYGLW